MANIIRFVADYNTDYDFFYEGQEYEYYDKYWGLNTPMEECCNPMSWIYRIINTSALTGFDNIPEEYVIELNEYTEESNHDAHSRKSREEQWGDTVTTDEITKYYEVEDYVKAAKEFLGIDISAKDREDQCDYAYEINYPKETQEE